WPTSARSCTSVRAVSGSVRRECGAPSSKSPSRSRTRFCRWPGWMSSAFSNRLGLSNPEGYTALSLFPHLLVVPRRIRKDSLHIGVPLSLLFSVPEAMVDTRNIGQRELLPKVVDQVRG